MGVQSGQNNAGVVAEYIVDGFFNFLVVKCIFGVDYCSLVLGFIFIVGLVGDFGVIDRMLHVAKLAVGRFSVHG